MFTPNEPEKTQDIQNEGDAVCQGPAVHTVGLVLEDDLFHISSQQDRQNLGEQFVVCAEERQQVPILNVLEVLWQWSNDGPPAGHRQSP